MCVTIGDSISYLYTGSKFQRQMFFVYNNAMKRNILEVVFYFGLLGVSAAFLFTIFMPFLSALFIAGLFAIVFYPVYEYVKRNVGGRENAGALLTVLLVLVVIMLPLLIMTTVLVQESLDVTREIRQGDGLVELVQDGLGKIEDKFNEIAPDAGVSVDLQNVISAVESWVKNNIVSVFSSVVKILINLFLVIIALFFFLRDGEKIKQVLVTWSPLEDKYDLRIMEKIRLAVDAVVKGSLLIAMIQGFLVAIGFLLFGVPSVVLWGFVATIGALIPSVGTAIVWVPGVLYLFFVANEPLMAVLLAAWGVVIVGLIDNFLRPILIERSVKIHPFLILLSVFGGIIMLGPIGFVAGPIVLSFVFALIEVYPKLMHNGEDE
jgi:predicted PurR-regulated permease PerM